MAASTYRALALKAALGEVGVKEQPAGSNRGPRVDVYEKVTGELGEPWCASLVQWSFKQAGYPQPLLEKSAYVPTIVTLARQHGWTVSASKAAPGDLACYDWQHDGVADHIGIVKTKPVGGKFTAVEGNTSVGNDSNGGEVMVRDRNVADVQAFIRIPGSPAAKKPVAKKTSAATAKPEPVENTAPPESVQITGPKGGVIARRTAAAAAKLVPALVKRFGRIGIRKAK